MSTDLTTTEDGAEENKRRDHPLGIYFGLDEDEYHADIASGSSDIKRLSYSPADWYWESKWNPLWEPSKLTPALITGRARHTMVLEGRKKFESQYGRKTLSFTTKEGKLQKAEFEEMGIIPLDADDYDRTLLLGEIIRANPHISNAFEDAVGTEVSVFWERRGMKRKARIDCLKTRAIVDLKNISNEREIPFPRACLRYIDNYHAHVQAEHYREGRLAMRGLFAERLVFGKDYDPEKLKQAVMADEWAWVWIFAQSSGAPLTHAYKMSYRKKEQIVDEDGEVMTVNDGYLNPIFELGRQAITKAEKNYDEYYKRYGLQTPWLLTHPIDELDTSQMPSWFLRGGDELGS